MANNENNLKKYISLTRLSDFLDNIKAKYSQIGHKHTTSDLTDYKVDTVLSSTSTNPVQNKVIDAEFEAMVSAMGALELAIDGKSDTSHSHNDTYYTEVEVDSLLSGKSDSTHNHDSKYDSKGSASAVQENLDAVSDTIDSHIDNTNIHVTTTNKSNWNSSYTHSTSAHARTDATKVEDSATNGNIKINGTETNVYSHPNSGVTAGTYKSVTVNAQGHVTAGTNPTTLAGYGITDAESKGAASSALSSAKEYTDTVASGKSNTNHNHDSAYDTKGAASNALESAKTYADSAATTAANKVKDDLLNGAGTAFDTLKELGDLITDNQDAIDALETVAAGKADKTHSHAISDVTNLQSTLDGKAAKSHGTHVSYSTTAPVMDGTASVGTATTVARSDHKHPTDTSRASKTEFDSHTSNTTVHITSTERSNWNVAKTHADSAHAPSNAEKNQNAFSNVKVGSTTIAADTATDTLELVGSNVTITPDATNDKVTVSVADASTDTKGIVQLTNSTSSTSTTTAATPNSVKSAYDLANTAKTNAATAQTKANEAYDIASAALPNTGGTMTGNLIVTGQIDVRGNAASQPFKTRGIVGSDGNGTVADLYFQYGANAEVKLGNTGAYKITADGGTYSGTAAKAVKDGDGKTITTTYETKTDAKTKLTEAKEYTDTVADTKANTSHTHTVANITDLTATATELNYMDGVTSNVQTQLDAKSDSGHNHIYYGVCSTAAATAAKTVTVDNFSLVTGAMVIVKFSEANSASSPTLNVNGTGAKPIYRYGTTAASTGASSTGWRDGAVQTFVYDGTGWIRDFWENTTYSNVSLGQGYATCSTAASTTAKTASLSSYTLATGGIVSVKFTNAVPANATLNINSKGAKSIYYRGAAITANIIKAGDTATFIYNSQYHLISIDRWQQDIEAKQNIITGAATTITGSNLTANRALISNGSGKVAVSDVTSTELGYLDGVTSNVQTQLDNITDAKADWNQNDSTQLNFIKNRPFYTTDPVDTVVADGTVPAGGQYGPSASIDSLVLGETYTAVFDGTTYTNLVCAEYSGLPAIGNDLFVLAISNGRTMIIAKDSSVSHSIKVIANIANVIPIERKYIAEHIDNLAGEKVDGKVYTIDGVEVVAEGGAEVFNDYDSNIASGSYSHAEGINNIASGSASHAEGYGTKASGSYSHAEGYGTTASESRSHAEGWSTEATAQGAHAEGFATHATGQNSHAEGDNSWATGRASHAEGYGTNAAADYSHAEGMNTNASSKYQHVQGKYNVIDANDTYAHIVGNGTSNSNRKNIHTIDWGGNGWFAGDIYVGGTGQDDVNASKVCTESYINQLASDVNNQLSSFGATLASKASTATYTGTFSTSGWSSSAPYTQTITVNGLLATDNPFADINLSGVSNAASALEEWRKIGRITVSANNTLVAYCYEEKPTVAISVILKVVR